MSSVLINVDVGMYVHWRDNFEKHLLYRHEGTSEKYLQVKPMKYSGFYLLPQNKTK